LTLQEHPVAFINLSLLTWCLKLINLGSLLEDHLIISLCHILSNDFRGLLEYKVIIISDINCHSVHPMCRNL